MYVDGKYSGQYTAAVGLTPVQIVVACPKRVRLQISAPATNRVTISQLPNVADQQGQVLVPGSPPMDEMGSDATKPHFAIGNVAGLTVQVHEEMMP